MWLFVWKWRKLLWISPYSASHYVHACTWLFCAVYNYDYELLVNSFDSFDEDSPWIGEVIPKHSCEVDRYLTQQTQENAYLEHISRDVSCNLTPSRGRWYGLMRIRFSFLLAHVNNLTHYVLNDIVDIYYTSFSNCVFCYWLMHFDCNITEMYHVN